MKIGIITHWTGKDNYGQVLQCYALQQHLKKEGHHPFLIRYIPTLPPTDFREKLRHFWRYLTPSHIVAHLRYRIGIYRDRAYYRKHNPELRKFAEFREKYISQSAKIYHTFEEMQQEQWEAECFITGSDQVWNCPAIHQKSYFLQFADTQKRIAYAASFGKSVLDEAYQSALPALLKGFTAIGVREDRGVEFCHSAGRQDAELVCDPTLLLSAEEYLSRLSISSSPQGGKHLFCYFLNWQTEIPTQEITTFSTQEGLSIRYFNAHALELEDFVTPYEDLTIESWIGSLREARYAITNSFHGALFSIIMHTPFVVLPLRGNYTGMNVRLETLLNRLGLRDRICQDRSQLQQLLTTPICWQEVDAKIASFRTQSTNFLKRAL